MMTRLQKVQIQLSECREKLNGLLSKDGDLTDAERESRDKMTNSYPELEKQLRAELTLEGERRESSPDAKRAKDLDNRVELRAYFETALSGGRLEGRQAELNRELKLGDQSIPWVAIAPAAVEARADAATSISSTVATQTNQDMILARVFANTTAQFLGVEMPSVAAGESAYPVITGGATGTQKAQGTTQDAVAATITANGLSPLRLTARYLFRMEDAARLVGLESALRQDLSGALGQSMDDQIVAGNGTSPNVAGFFRGLSSPTQSTGTTTYSGFISGVAGAVDGRFAGMLSDVKAVVGAETYGFASGTFPSTGSASAAAYLETHSGGFRASVHVPQPDAQKRQKGILSRGMLAMGSAVAPVWEGVQLIRDSVTNAASGQVALTAIALWNFKIIRTAGFSLVEFRG